MAQLTAYPLRTAWPDDTLPRGGPVEVDAEGMPIKLSTGMLQALQHVVEHKRRTLADLHTALGNQSGDVMHQ